MKIIVLFNLKPGVSISEYEEWARTRDIPGVNALSSVTSFTVHKATGLFGSDAAAPYQYIEIIDIPAMDPFVARSAPPNFRRWPHPSRIMPTHRSSS